MVLSRNKKNMDTFWWKKGPYQVLFFAHVQDGLNLLILHVQRHFYASCSPNVRTYFLWKKKKKKRKTTTCPLLVLQLTLVLLNKLRCHAHFQFSAYQITWSGLLIQIHILNDKQCRSRLVGFFRSQLIWIYTVCKDWVYPGSAGLRLRVNKMNTYRMIEWVEMMNSGLRVTGCGNKWLLVCTNTYLFSLSRNLYTALVLCPALIAEKHKNIFLTHCSLNRLPTLYTGRVKCQF